MEGYAVLRAAALAGVPARRGARALERRWRARPRHVAVRRGAGRARRGAAVADRGGRSRALSCRRRCRPPSARSARSIARDDPRLRRPLLARAAARAPARGRRPAQRPPVVRACRCSCFWAATPLVRRGVRLGVLARARAPPTTAPRVALARLDLPAVPGAARRVHPARGRVVRAVRACRPGRDGRGPRLPRRARARPPARRRRLRPRPRIARGARRRRRRRRDRRSARCCTRQGDNGQRVALVARRPRPQPAALPRRRAAVSRPGRQGRLRRIRPKETPRCPFSSSCRR